jgi:hypothetical protein
MREYTWVRVQFKLGRCSILCYNLLANNLTKIQQISPLNSLFYFTTFLTNIYIYIYILSFFLLFVQRCFFIKKIILCTCEAITLRVAPEHEFGSFHLFYPFFLSITIVLRILGYLLNNWTHQILQHCIYISKTLIITLQQNSHLQTEFKRRGSQLPGHLMF